MTRWGEPCAGASPKTQEAQEHALVAGCPSKGLLLQPSLTAQRLLLLEVHVGIEERREPDLISPCVMKG